MINNPQCRSHYLGELDGNIKLQPHVMRNYNQYKSKEHTIVTINQGTEMSSTNYKQQKLKTHYDFKNNKTNCKPKTYNALNLYNVQSDQ